MQKEEISDSPPAGLGLCKGIIKLEEQRWENNN